MQAAIGVANRPSLPASFLTDDVDEYAARLAHWRIRNNQLSLGKFAGRVDHLELPSLQIFRKRTNRTLLESLEGPPGIVSVAIPLFQDGEVYNGGEMLNPGQASFLNGGANLTLRSSEQLDMIAVSLERRVMLGTLRDVDMALADRFGQLEFGSLVMDSAVNPELARTLLAPMSELPGLPDWLESDAQQSDYLEQVCLLIAAALCGAESCDRAHRVRDSRQQLVARATRFLDRSWFEPIRITDICKELNADRRTLQNAFQEVLGVSPNAFFKNVRLNRAHQDLKRRGDCDEPICDVAMRHGFWHLSQFARDYQRAFGELPSETRRRARLS